MYEFYMNEDVTSNTRAVDYGSIYRSKEFNECMNNYFNTQDEMTRKVLLTVNEADQNLMMQSLASKLYKHIVSKVDDVDFGMIPMSKGDITKVDKYEELSDCISVIADILNNYRQPTTLVDTVSIALQNMVDRKELFMRGFRGNADMVMMTYNTLALSIVSAVSLMISSSIEFIKLPENKGFNIAFDKTSKLKGEQKILYKNLNHFNKLCANGKFDQTMEYAIKNNMLFNFLKKNESAEVVSEAVPPILVQDAIKTLGTTAAGFVGAHPVIGITAGVIAGVILLIIIIKELIYYFYYARTKASDYFDAQSSLLVMNAYNVENSLTRDETERKTIAEKQNRVAQFFSKLANKLNVSDRTAESKASKDIDTDNKQKFTYNDVVASIPDSANAALF